MANSQNRGLFEDIARQGAAHSDYDEVFGGWRMAALDSWDGTLASPRYRDGMALVPIGYTDLEVIVLVLENEGGQWGLEDINSPSRDDFATYDRQGDAIPKAGRSPR